MHDKPWGLSGYDVYGSMVLGYFADNQAQTILNDLRDNLQNRLPENILNTMNWAATRKNNFLILRALSPQSAPIKRLFQSAWDYTRPYSWAGKLTPHAYGQLDMRKLSRQQFILI